jgi:hypothetical protein
VVSLEHKKRLAMKWRDNNRERLSEEKKKWYRNNIVRSKAGMKRWREEHPDEVKDSNLRFKYGITLDSYNRLHEEQGGGCAICGRGGDGKKLHVDHDHISGIIRGLLCNRCNLMVGMSNDDPTVLERATHYLRENMDVRNDNRRGS